MLVSLVVLFYVTVTVGDVVTLSLYPVAAAVLTFTSRVQVEP